MHNDDRPQPAAENPRGRSAAELRDELRNLAAELSNELRDVAGEVRSAVAEARDEVRKDVRDELDAAIRSVRILWDVDDPPSRGPRATLSRDKIVTAAIDLADERGLDEASMRSVAKRLGVGTMSLYRHVPGRDELVAMMIDRVNAETPLVGELPGSYRERLEALAWGEWVLGHRHPWIFDVPSQFSRPVAGPNGMARYDSALAAAADTGLPPAEVVKVVHAVLYLADGATRAAVEHATSERRTGVSHEQWWTLRSEALGEVVNDTSFPTFVRLAQAGAFGEHGAGRQYEDPLDFEAQFTSGLAALLDGIEARVAAFQRSERAEGC